MSPAPSFRSAQYHFPEHPIINTIDEAARLIRMIIFDNPAPREAWDPSIPNIIGARELDDILVFIPGVAEEKAIEPNIAPFAR